MKKLIILFFILFNLVVNASPIRLIPGNEDDDDGKAGVIKGVIVDENTDQPMEYANVAVYNAADSSLVTGGITDEKGEFEIKGINFGDYYLVANFIGFNKLN